MKEMFADETTLKLLSKSDILKNNAFFGMDFMIYFEYFFSQVKLLWVPFRPRNVLF